MEENVDKLIGLKIDEVEPEFENISTQKYPVARSLFVYVKNAHAEVIPGIRDFIAEYVSDRSMAENGYLEKKGLVPLTKAQRELVRKNALTLTPMK